MHKKRAGNGSSPPPALHFLGFDDRIQQRQLLTGGAVQRFKALIHGCRVDIGYPPCQFLFPCFGFGIVNDHMDRNHFSDSGHLFCTGCAYCVLQQKTTPVPQFQKWETHTVFPHFWNFEPAQNISLSFLADLCGVALV